MIELRRRVIRRGRHAFTLVELMVAIALVLVIIIGVNEVFRLTSNTINAGQTLSSSVRDQRAVRTTMEDDFSHMAPDGPALIITNKAVAAFRSREDELASQGLLGASIGTVNRVTNNHGQPIAGNPLHQDLNGDGVSTEPGDTGYLTGEYATPATPNSRVRRVDTVTFFVRRPGMAKQTPNYTSGTFTAADFVGKAVANEAMVTYGHLRLPENSSTQLTGTVNGYTYPGSTYFEPGEPTKALPGDTNLFTTQPSGMAGKQNDNNKYYTQWVLGRGQMLMGPNSSVPANETRFTASAARGVGGTGPLNLQPLSMRTNAGTGNGALANGSGGLVVRNRGPYSSVCDLADISITAFSQSLANYVRDVSLASSTSDYSRPENNGLWFLPAAASSYSDTAEVSANAGAAAARLKETLSYRYNGNPFGTRGYTAAGANLLAQTLGESAPVLVPRCTNFIVEFAGDFVTQDDTAVTTAGNPNPNYGIAYKAVPDDEIDFVVQHGVRKIRWYGLPRYTGSGDVEVNGSGYTGPRVRGVSTPGSINVVEGSATVTYSPAYESLTPFGGPTEPNHKQLPEVVPVSDMLCAATGSTGNQARIPSGKPVNVAPFEKVLMTNATLPNNDKAYFYDINAALGSTTVLNVNNFLPPQENYANPTGDYTLQRANYVCAWQGTQPRPKMIRITMTLEDPNSRSDNGGQTYEYVFNVP